MAVEKNIKINVDAKNAIKDVKALDKGVKDTSKSAAGTKGSFGKMTGAVKGLGVAFKALGIGLIVAALMKLKDIFSGNIETARMFERVTSQLSAAFDVIRDRAEDFIKSLIKLKNPLQAFKEAFTGTTAEIKEETKAMGALTKQLQEVRDEERDLMLERSKANKIIAESRLLAEDDTKSMEERLVALKTAVAEEKRVADLEVATQEKKVEAMQKVIDLGKSSEEDIANLAAETARLIDLQTASTLKQKRVAAEIGTFTSQIEKKNAKIEKDKLDRIELNNKAKELELQITEEMSNKEIADLIKKKEKELQVEQQAADKLKEEKKKEADDLLAIQKKKVEEEKKIRDAEILSRKSANIDAAKSLLGSLSQIAGEGTKAGKAAALGQILMDTATGISASIANATKSASLAGPGAAVVTPILIAQLLAQVLGGMASAKAILKKVPGPGGDSGGDENVNIPAGSNGGFTGFGGLTPNLEAISPPDLDTVQPVQAFVVENDISDAQALQEELEIQATL